MTYLFYLILSVFFITGIMYSVGGLENIKKFTKFQKVKLEEETISRFKLDNFFQKQLLIGYKCEKNTCVKTYSVITKDLLTLDTCSMLCEIPKLWPKPKKFTILNKNSTQFTPDLFTINYKSAPRVKRDLIRAVNIFKKNTFLNQKFSGTNVIDNVTLNIEVKNNDHKLELTTDEKYVLTIKNLENYIKIDIITPNYFGARHALETLSQLIWFEKDYLRIIHDVSIVDQPSFPHRGLMVDVARNYFAVTTLKKIIDGMAMTKLNVLHLHLTDSVSFPIILPNNRIFAEFGAYGPNKVYSSNDVKDLIEYARIRGIRTVLEIDAPSHVNEGWNYPNKNTEKLIICGEDDVNNGHLNIDNNNTLPILESIYRDLLELGTDETYFHIGADEVNTTCFEQTETAKNYTSMNDLWIDLTNDMLDLVKSANDDVIPKHIVLWSSPLTDKYIDKLKYQSNLLVQYWYGNPFLVLSSDVKIVFSTVGQWYLDCGFGGWKPKDIQGSCTPYTTWQTFYLYRPWETYSNYMDQILGGESCIWNEMITEETLEVLIWPRAAAMAERLWSDILVFDADDVYSRLSNHRNRMVKLGLKAQGIWPEWCVQNPSKC